MKAKKLTTHIFPMLPIMVNQIRDKRCSMKGFREYADQATQEIAQREQDLERRYARLAQGPRSRVQRRFADPCFEMERDILDLAKRALNGLKLYVATFHLRYLNEALAHYDASEQLYDDLIKSRIRLPASVQEDLQRAA